MANPLSTALACADGARNRAKKLNYRARERRNRVLRRRVRNCQNSVTWRNHGFKSPFETNQAELRKQTDFPPSTVGIVGSWGVGPSGPTYFVCTRGRALLKTTHVGGAPRPFQVRNVADGGSRPITPLRGAPPPSPTSPLRRPDVGLPRIRRARRFFLTCGLKKVTSSYSLLI